MIGGNHNTTKIKNRTSVIAEGTASRHPNNTAAINRIKNTHA
jgi:hypothetical protein